MSLILLRTNQFSSEGENYFITDETCGARLLADRVQKTFIYQKVITNELARILTHRLDVRSIVDGQVRLVVRIFPVVRKPVEHECRHLDRFTFAVQLSLNMPFLAQALGRSNTPEVMTCESQLLFVPVEGLTLESDVGGV